MNESQFKAAVCKSIRKQLPGAVVFRHEDRLTAGIPDISVTWHGRTVWLEAKILDLDIFPVEHLAKKFPLQARTIQQLVIQGNEKSGFLVLGPRRIAIISWRWRGMGWKIVREFDTYHKIVDWLE